MPHWTARARPLLALNLLVVLLTAWTSETFFHPDEHFQIVEFLGLKLGFTASQELPWEFAARIRPFLQPTLYYALLSPLIKLGWLSDRFSMLFLLRLFSGLIACLALSSLIKFSSPWVSTQHANTLRLRWLTCAGFIPYLAVRTSSENLSGSFFLFALAATLRAQAATDAKSAARQSLLAGFLLGVSFEFRYQMAFSILGLLAFSLFIARAYRTLPWVALGSAISIGLGTLADRWGYGEWVFAPWGYLRVNLFEGKAAEFGTKWFFAYLHITLANLFAPVVILTFVGLILCWIRRPRHVVTWTTLPFVLGHSALGHKEERFLFPILLLGIVAAAMGFELTQEEVKNRAQRACHKLAEAFERFRRRLPYRMLVAWNLLGMALLALYPLGWKPHEPFARWVESLPGPVHLIAEDVSILPSYPFLRSRAWHLHTLEPGQAADRSAGLGQAAYFIRREPFSGLDAAALGVDAELIYTEFPASNVAWLREHVWPPLDRLRAQAIGQGFQEKRVTWLSAYRVRPQPPR